MATIADTGGSKRLQAMFDRLRTELPTTMRNVAEVMAGEAASRAPTPQEEYETLMVGDGNPEGITNVPPMPTSINDTDGDSKRLRFFKPEQLYLQNMLIGSYKCDGLMIGVGSIAELNAASVYEWKNVTGDIYSTNFPAWEFWETGVNGSFYIEPKNFSGKHEPTLKPGKGKENYRYFMYKRIPGRRMLTGINVDKYIQSIILPAVKRIAAQG
jgi:hypothetical protein